MDDQNCTEVANYCLNCHANFNSTISSLMRPGVRVIGCFETCPRCGSEVAVPDVVGLSVAGESRFKPAKAPATRILMSKLRKLDNEIYFAVGNHVPVSCVWKIFKQGENIYLLSREFDGWKASFHRSGYDNIGFTSEAYRARPDIQKVLPSRHFFTAHRNVAPLAHVIRVLRLKIFVRSPSPSPIILPLKSKQQKILKFIPYMAKKNQYIVELFYSHDNPSEYLETKFPDKNILAMMRGRPNEYFTLVVDSNIPFEDGDVLSEAAKFRKFANAEAASVRDQILTFGVSRRNTFLVNIGEDEIE